jgi:hypothetical protein
MAMLPVGTGIEDGVLAEGLDAWGHQRHVRGYKIGVGRLHECVSGKAR